MTTPAASWGVPQNQFWLYEQRPDQPVRYESDTGFWSVFGYSEVQQVLTDPATFSSNTQRVLPEYLRSPLNDGAITLMDPPEHRKLRKLVSHAFTPKMVADLEPRITEVTTELLENMGPRSELVSELAYPLPVIVIAELLGVPTSDRHLFRQWVDAMFHMENEQISLLDEAKEERHQTEAMLAEVQKLSEYLTEHAEERMNHPRQDLLTKLVHAEVDGERLPPQQAVNFALILLVAGHITTTMLLGNTILCLDEHPEQLAEVRRDRSLVPAAIEESLRFLSPFSAVGRVTTREVELGGERVPADNMLLLSLGAANRDEQCFAEPHGFDIHRDPNPHLAFGRGIHFCLGAPLARLEGRIALNLMLDAFPNLSRDRSGGLEFMPNPNMAGVHRMWLHTSR